jgi:hypothetical protein
MARRSPKMTRRAAAGSWLALLAATTLGDGADTLHADIRANGLRDGAYRLVVQTYDNAGVRFPGREARPVGSVQRAVTADELRQGVRVNLLELRDAAAEHGSSPVVVAWVEAGQPDLEFDGRKARPNPGNMYGVVRRFAKQEGVQIRLDRVAV